MLAGCNERAAPLDACVIIHADDAGMCASVNCATIDAMERGVVSSASILVPCPAFEEFARYAAQHPEKDFGVHLALNSEWEQYRWGPVAPRDRVPSLVDAEGFLWKTVADVVAYVRPEEAEIELRAQIEKATSRGIRLTHLDTHMYALGSRPDLLKLYIRLGTEYDLPVLLVREPMQDSFVHQNTDVATTYYTAIELLDSRGYPLPDFLDEGNYFQPPDEKRAYYLTLLRAHRGGVLFIPIHCGYDDQELRSITDSSQRRDADRCVFTSLEMRDELMRTNLTLTSWSDLQRLARSARAP